MILAFRQKSLPCLDLFSNTLISFFFLLWLRLYKKNLIQSNLNQDNNFTLTRCCSELGEFSLNSTTACRLAGVEWLLVSSAVLLELIGPLLAGENLARPFHWSHTTYLSSMKRFLLDLDGINLACDDSSGVSMLLVE